MPAFLIKVGFVVKPLMRGLLFKLIIDSLFAPSANILILAFIKIFQNYWYKFYSRNFL